MKKLLSLAILLGAFSVAHAADIEAGKASYATCVGCHGATGAGLPAAGYPALSGQSAEYIEEQLHAFKSGKRVNPTMNAMANLLATDQDVANVAAYIATLK